MLNNHEIKIIAFKNKIIQFKIKHIKYEIELNKLDNLFCKAYNIKNNVGVYWLIMKYSI